MTELGVNAGVVVALSVALVLVRRFARLDRVLTGAGEEFGDAGPGQPAAAERPSFLLDQAAPYPVSADAARMPQREFQAVRAYRAAGADGDGLGRLVPGLGHVVGHGKPVVRIDGRTPAHRAC